MNTNQKTDEIAEEIRKLSEAMRRFRDGKLNQRCILILLRDVTGLGMAEIKAVLDGAAGLDERFLKKTKQPK